MPLDGYSPTISRKPDYAMALLEQPCMERRGFKRPVPWQDTTKLDAPLRSVFTTDVAAHAGYHTSGVSLPPHDDAWTSFANATLSPSAQAALDSCIAEAYKELPLPGPSENLAFGLASAAYDRAMTSNTVKSAGQRWKSCMRPYGVIDLPDDPVEMPSPSLAKKFDLGGSASPSAEELKIAVADVGCRESSGWAKASYDAEWNAQVAILEKNQNQLEAAKRDIDDYERRVMKAITENEPAR